ncbi:MAG TPA: DUF4292 domain-containing protein [Anaeromyxobacteraceae bacterium]|nr:DUF4292 domain-containing protein [Anaeromyxobacteraceae bacterium]
MRTRPTLVSTLLLALSGLVGCPRVPPPALSRDPAALLDQVKAGQRRVQRVSGRARVKVTSPSLSGTVTELIAVEKPDRLHLQTLDFFGNPAAVLVAADGRFALHDLRGKVFYRGPATPENVSRLLPFDLPVEELVTILCGSAPLLPGTPLEVGAQEGLVLLTIGLGEVGQRLALGEQATVLWSRLRRDAPPGSAPEVANPGYDLAFDHFVDRGGLRFPNALDVDAPAGKARVELSWRDVEVNGEVDRALFRLLPPPGVQVVDLDGHAPAPRQPIPPE